MSSTLSFLSSSYESGLSYNSLNCFRSAISLLSGSDIGQDSLIRRFFRGIGKLRPPKARYNCTWDPKIVLDYFRDLPKNEELSLGSLARKVVVLLALVTGQRIQTLHLIRTENVKISSSIISILIPDQIKTSAPKRFQPCLTIPYFLADSRVCAASALVQYMEATASLRQSEPYLFLTTRQPFSRASKDTLARWIKDVLKASGLDMSLFTAHSARHAATSSAKEGDIDLNIIFRSAGWTQNSATFARFYDRPIISDPASFGQAIYRRSYS